MKRVLLKLSGEALAGDKKTGFDEATCMGVAKQVKQLVDDGVQVAIVTGGGNFWRGRTSETIDRVKADQIGMLATVMNCIYVSDIFRYAGMKTEVFTPFVCGAFTTLFSKDAAVEALNEGKVVFFAGGTGHPYFSTDTGAVLRAIEIEADAMLLAKAIDGIYDSPIGSRGSVPRQSCGRWYCFESSCPAGRTRTISSELPLVCGRYPY